MSDTRNAIRAVGWLVLLASPVAPAQEPKVADPMRPFVAAPAAEPASASEEALPLTAVLVSPSRRIAVIDGRFYGVGDRVNGNEIVRIEPGAIEIMRAGRRISLSLREKRATGTDNDGDQGP